jgi:hypothetical protein
MPTIDIAATSLASSSDAKCSPATDGNSVSAGHAAGIGIGAFIIGVALGIIGAWIFKKLPHGRKQIWDGRTGEAGRSTNPQYPNELQITTPPLDQILLEQIPDSVLKDDARGLNTQIDQHVRNNYHGNPVNVDDQTIQILKSTFNPVETGLSAESFVAHIQTPAYRRAAISHLISWTICSAVSPNETSSESLLLSPIAEFLRKIPEPDNSPGSLAGTCSNSGS